MVSPASPIRAHFVVGRVGSPPVRSPASPVVRPDWPPIHRANVVSPFSRSLACSGGDQRRVRGQTAQLALGASVTAPALWPVIPRHPAPATDPLAGFGRCRLWRVSDTRSKPLNPEDSIKGYPQQTRSGTQDRSRRGDRLGKRGRRHHPAQRHLFAHLPRRGAAEDDSELRLQEPADSRQTRRSGAHAHCRAQRRGGAVGQRGRR